MLLKNLTQIYNLQLITVTAFQSIINNRQARK